MKTIVSFCCDGNPVPNFETPEPPGKEVAELLGSCLRRIGAEFEQVSPAPGEGGWSWWFSVASGHFKLFLNSAGLGSPLKDYWVASFFWVRRGILGRFSKQAESRFAALLGSLAAAMDAERAFTNVRWWEEGDFVGEVLKPGTRGL